MFVKALLELGFIVFEFEIAENSKSQTPAITIRANTLVAFLPFEDDIDAVPSFCS